MRDEGRYGHLPDFFKTQFYPHYKAQIDKHQMEADDGFKYATRELERQALAIAEGREHDSNDTYQEKAMQVVLDKDITPHIIEEEIRKALLRYQGNVSELMSNRSEMQVKKWFGFPKSTQKE